MYNLEVDADHCYRVGEQGILVHNASVPVAGDATAQANYNRIFCHPCKIKRRNKTKNLTTSAGSFTAKVEVAIGDDNREISYAEAGIARNTVSPVTLVNTKPVVCKVHEISGIIQAPPAPRVGGQFATAREGYQDLTKELHIVNSPDPAVNTNTYNAGHLIGLSFGGPDSVYAIVPMNKDLNQFQAWRNMESRIQYCLESMSCIESLKMNVKVIYNNKGSKEFIPSDFVVATLFSRGAALAGGGSTLYFNNVSGDKRSFGTQSCLAQWIPNRP